MAAEVNSGERRAAASLRRLLARRPSATAALEVFERERSKLDEAFLARLSELARKGSR